MEPDNTKDVEIEIELLRRIGEGDRQSFSELYDRFARVLLATAYGVIRNQETAEDVVQEVFLQIWQRSHLFVPGRGKPLTWAMTLTRNKAIDRMRSVQRRSVLMEGVQREAEVHEQHDDHDSFHAVAVIESAAGVREALKKLPDGQREAIELVFLSAMTLPEAAKHLSEPLSTVKARLRRGLIRLRALVSKDI